MNYLITYEDSGLQLAYYTKNFNVEKDYVFDCGMIVFDLINHKYMVNSLGWTNIQTHF